MREETEAHEGQYGSGRQILDQLVSAAEAPRPERTSPLEPRQLTMIDSATLAANELRLDWLVEDMVLRKQPLIMGGPPKAMKTTILVDLVLSLSCDTCTHRPGPGHVWPNRLERYPRFLDHFPICGRRRVGVFSAESNQAVLSQMAQRICDSRRISLARCGVYWSFRAPSLGVPNDLEQIARLIAQHDLDVVAIDPLYLALLGGDAVDTANLYHVGPRLAAFSEICIEAGATPIIIHHTRKSRRGEDRSAPLELEDFTYGGVAEFARQWLLINRREPYLPGTHQHRLWLSAGGSAGFSGVWAVDIDESPPDGQIEHRGWNVSVRNAAELKEKVHPSRQGARDTEKATWRQAVLDHLSRPENRDGDSATALARACGLNKPSQIRPIINELVHERRLVTARLKKGNRICDGFRLAEQLAASPSVVASDAPR